MKEEYIESYTFATATDFLELFSIDGKYANVCSGSYIFRGLKNVEYDLTPTALRENNAQDIFKLCSDEIIKSDINKDSEFWQIITEYDIIKQFFDIADRAGLSIPEIPKLRRCLNDVSILIKGFNYKEWLPENMFAIAGLAQHYGLPTRLLDWSYDYKVGLYFATSGIFNNCQDEEKNTDAILYAVNYSDLQWLGKLNNNGYCLHFIRPNYFGNPNLSAQKGLFTVLQLLIDHNNISVLHENVDRRPLDKILLDYIISSDQSNDIFKENKLIYKFIIPRELKLDILKQLSRDGYTEEYLFPGFNGVARQIKNRALFNSEKKCLSSSDLSKH